MKNTKNSPEATHELIATIEHLVKALHTAADNMEFHGCYPEMIAEARNAAQVNCYLSQYGINIKAESTY